MPVLSQRGREIEAIMSIPEYQSFMLPPCWKPSRMASNTFFATLLVIWPIAWGCPRVNDRSFFLVASKRVANRVGWAKTYLKEAGLLANPTKGSVSITKEGTDALAQHPPKIDNEFLKTLSVLPRIC
jgi:restriction system protein